jgi:hypothetical protein
MTNQRNLLKKFGSLLLSLPLVDVFHQDSLVLKHITLSFHVENMVHVVIDLLCFSVLAKQSSQHSHTSDPDGLLGHTGVGSTFSLTMTTVSSLSSCFISNTYSGTTVNDLWLLDDETIFYEFANVLAYKNIQNNSIYLLFPGSVKGYFPIQSTLKQLVSTVRLVE